MSKKWLFTGVGIVLAFTALFFCFPSKNAVADSSPATGEEKKVSFDATEVDKVSQMLGHMIVRHLNAGGVFKFNVERVIAGMQAEHEGKAAPMNEEEYEKSVSRIQESAFLELTEKNLSLATAFLEKNATEEGIVALNPKLQYKITQAGDGDVVTADATPLVHYTGKLLDGTVFSSSEQSGAPIAIPIKQTIPGFSEGLVGMKKGEKRTLFVHPELAYGVAGHLPPNSLLIFEVEMMEVNTPQAAEEVSSVVESEPKVEAEAAAPS